MFDAATRILLLDRYATILKQLVHVTGAVANNGTPVPTSVVETMQGRMARTL